MARVFAVASTEVATRANSVIQGDAPCSFGAWIKIATFASARMFLAFGTAGAVARMTLSVTTSPAASITSVNAAASSASATGATTLSAGTWYYVMGVLTSDSLRDIYVNGVSDGTNGTSISVGGTLDETLIGARRNTTLGLYFDGSIAEAAAWNVVLTAGERLALGQGANPLNVRPTALKMYVPLLGSAAHDVLGGPFTLTGTTLAADHPPKQYHAS